MSDRSENLEAIDKEIEYEMELAQEALDNAEDLKADAKDARDAGDIDLAKTKYMQAADETQRAANILAMIVGKYEVRNIFDSTTTFTGQFTAFDALIEKESKMRQKLRDEAKKADEEEEAAAKKGDKDLAKKKHRESIRKAAAAVMIGWQMHGKNKAWQAVPPANKKKKKKGDPQESPL